MDKLSLVDIKRKNYADVYRYIYENQKPSKQSIAQALNMSLPTVSQHLTALSEKGLIEKCGQLDSAIGRKAAAYSIVTTAAISIGVEITRNYVLILSIDLYGEVLQKKKIDMLYENTDAYIEKVCSSVIEFANSRKPDTVIGVAFGLQGLVSNDGRSVIYGKILDFTDFRIETFEQYLPYPCCFVHDSEAAAAADIWKHNIPEDIIYLSIGSHIGAAVIIDGKIHHGRTGRTGTVEHMTLIPGGQLCYCGKRGCVDSYCSLEALLKGNESLEQFFEQKEKGDQNTLRRWYNYLDMLSMSINNFHMVMDIAVVIGGHIAPYMNEHDIEYLHTAIHGLTTFPEDKPFIYLGKRRHHGVAIGAALTYTRQWLEEI